MNDDIFMVTSTVCIYALVVVLGLTDVACLTRCQVCIGGGAGFIGSHLALRLKSMGWYVICADWKENEFMKPKVSGDGASRMRRRWSRS